MKAAADLKAAAAAKLESRKYLIDIFINCLTVKTNRNLIENLKMDEIITIDKFEDTIQFINEYISIINDNINNIKIARLRITTQTVKERIKKRINFINKFKFCIVYLYLLDNKNMTIKKNCLNNINNISNTICVNHLLEGIDRYSLFKFQEIIFNMSGFSTDTYNVIQNLFANDKYEFSFDIKLDNNIVKYFDEKKKQLIDDIFEIIKEPENKEPENKEPENKEPENNASIISKIKLLISKLFPGKPQPVDLSSSSSQSLKTLMIGGKKTKRRCSRRRRRKSCHRRRRN